jgi:integrase
VCGVDEIGRPLRPDTLSDRFDQLVARAGVRRILLHDARHTCGTLMHLSGEPVAVISARLGHSSPAFTMRVYVHSQDDALKDVAVCDIGVT